MTAEPQKRRYGPLPKPEEEKRNRRISVYLTDAEYSKLLKRVRTPGELSAYTRHQLFAGKKPYIVSVPETNYAAWAATAGLANNLNQLVRKLGGVGVVDADLQAVRDLVRELRAALLEVSK